MIFKQTAVCRNTITFTQTNDIAGHDHTGFEFSLFPITVHAYHGRHHLAKTLHDLFALILLYVGKYGVQHGDTKQGNGDIKIAQAGISNRAKKFLNCDRNLIIWETSFLTRSSFLPYCSRRKLTFSELRPVLSTSNALKRSSTGVR